MHLRRLTSFTVATLAVAALFSGCGDDGSSGSGGAGASTSASASAGGGGQGAGTSSGGAGQGGAGGDGGASSAGLITWNFDGTPHTTRDAQPPTASFQRSSSLLQLSVSGVDSVDPATFNASLVLSASGGAETIPAGTYACAPPNTLPSASASLAEGSIVATSGSAGHDCSLVLTEPVAEGGRIVGTIVGKVSDGATTFDFDAIFDLEDPPG